MLQEEIIRHRLYNQRIGSSRLRTAAEVVRWMCAMQAQQYYMAKWAVALRSEGLEDPDVEKAFNKGEILRTHLMRPTWHFVSPSDIRWMLKLTSPHVNKANAYMYRKEVLCLA